MKLNRMIFSLLALLLVPALACQTVMGGLSPTAPPTPSIDVFLTDVPSELATLVPEGTLPAIPTQFLEGDAPADIPIVPDPQNLTASAGLVSYTTTMPAEDVVNFYKEQMPVNGWAEAEGSISFGDITTLNYTKDSRTALVTVTKTGNEVVVGVVVQ